MNSVEKVKMLCKEKKISVSKLEKDLSFGNGYISSLRRGTFPAERLFAIANYFGVTVSDLLCEDKKTPDLKNEIGTDLDDELVRMLTQLDAVEAVQVRAYIQGLLASHKD